MKLLRHISNSWIEKETRPRSSLIKDSGIFFYRAQFSSQRRDLPYDGRIRNETVTRIPDCETGNTRLREIYRSCETQRMFRFDRKFRRFGILKSHHFPTGVYKFKSRGQQNLPRVLSRVPCGNTFLFKEKFEAGQQPVQIPADTRLYSGIKRRRWSFPNEYFPFQLWIKSSC